MTAIDYSGTVVSYLSGTGLGLAVFYTVYALFWPMRFARTISDSAT